MQVQCRCDRIGLEMILCGGMALDHSLRGYLERRNNQELFGILREMSENEDEHWDSEIVLIIIEVLKKRMAEGNPLGE